MEQKYSQAFVVDWSSTYYRGMNIRISLLKATYVFHEKSK